jgi:hypothetical protein
MAPTLFIVDVRMLELMDYCMRNKRKGIWTKTDFAEAIGIEHQNLPRVVKGVRGFTPAQQNAAATIFNVSMDWLYGFSD